MTSFSDSLRGYAYQIHKRDNFTCRYCGVIGTESFDTWLTLTVDHLLPKGHPNREHPDYMVTACHFCNTADNRYFDKVEKLGLKFDGLTPDELVQQRSPFVQKTRQSYREFWETKVRD